MKTITQPTTHLASVAEHSYHQLILQATMTQIEQASVWYFEAQEVAEDVAEIMGVSLEVGASIVASFSPRERWASNVAKSFAFAHGKPVKGLGNNLRMAQRSLELGFDALNGQKTNAFARAIAGDVNAVVCDVWICRAFNLGTYSPNKAQYKLMSDAIRNIANEFGITPRTCQALGWIIIRGSAE